MWSARIVAGKGLLLSGSGRVAADHELAVGVRGDREARGLQACAQRLHQAIGDPHRGGAQRPAVVAGEPGPPVGRARGAPPFWRASQSWYFHIVRLSTVVPPI